MTGPLSHLRVLSFGQDIAAPLASVLLADQGATVIAIEPESTPAIAQQPVDIILNRGKQVLRVDFQHDSAKIKDLAEGADIIIESLLPGTMSGFGLGYEQIKEINPGIVYVSIPAFAHSDPRAGLPALDGVISAASGLFTDISFWGASFALPPVFTSLPLPSVYAGLHAAIGAVAATIARLRDGYGDWLEAPLLDAAMSASAGPLLRTEGQPNRYNEPALPTTVIDHVNLRRLPSAIAKPMERFLDTLMPIWFRNYRCGDGRDIFITCIDNMAHIDKLLAAMGLDDKVEGWGLRRGNALDIPVSHDNLYAFRSNSAGLKKLQAEMEHQFMTRSASEWEDYLGRRGVPAAVQRTTVEWCGSLPIRDAGIIVSHSSSDGSILAPGLIGDVSSTRIDHYKLPSTVQPLSFTGWNEKRPFGTTAPSATSDNGPTAPLAGLKVLDLANVIAGPAASRTLAELGADVLHIDAPEPKMGPRMLLWIGQEVNQGKDCAVLDLHSERGHRIIDKLIAKADMVIYNKLPGQAQRLGVSPEHVHSINPKCIVTAVSAYSGSDGEGWEGRPAYDPVIQASSGVMQRFGGLGTPEVHGVAATIDYYTGFAGTFAALCALAARETGDDHLYARTSLSRAAAWVQVPFVTGRPTPEPSGQDARGYHPLEQLYRTSDGWIYLSVKAANYSSIKPHMEKQLGVTLDDDYMNVGELLASTFKHMTSARATSLGSPQMMIQQVLDIKALRKAAVTSEGTEPICFDAPSGTTLLKSQGPDRGALYVPDTTWLRFQSRPRHRLHYSHLPGADNRKIKEEYGLEEADLAESWDLSTGPLPA